MNERGLLNGVLTELRDDDGRLIELWGGPIIHVHMEKQGSSLWIRLIHAGADSCITIQAQVKYRKLAVWVLDE